MRSFGSFLIVIVIIGIVGGVAFGGGLAVGKGAGGKAASQASATPAAPPEGGVGGAAHGGAGAGAASAPSTSAARGDVPITGTVQSVTGNVITVAGTGGGASQFDTSSSMHVLRTVSASASDIQQGQTVMVIPGPTDSSGHYTAQAITILPAGETIPILPAGETRPGGAGAGGGPPGGGG